MNALDPILNDWSDRALAFAWPVLWQSSLLIGLLLAADLLLKRKLRPALRYALWLMVLVKLLLPPTLALPTSAAWWVRPTKPAPPPHRAVEVVVTYGPARPLPAAPPVEPTPVAPAPARLSPLAWMLIASLAISAGLLAWMIVRWAQVIREVRRAAPAPAWLLDLVRRPRRSLRVRLIDHAQSPAVCGLFRPVILLPRALTEQLAPAQLRAVLLHELLHLRRGDVWVNCLQALLQIVYWWHPLLWLANARIRRVREEAVDDAVMLALNEEAESYAPTLLEVAKLALPRPLASLGLVGILESRSALRERIERLVESRPPRKAGLTLGAALAVLGFAALAVPMEQAPAPGSGSAAVAAGAGTNNPVSTNAGLYNALAGLQTGIDALVRDGKLLYEMGKLGEAEDKLNKALRLDSENSVAHYYLELVKEAQLGSNNDKQQLLPYHMPPAQSIISGRAFPTNLVHVSTAGDRKTIIKALNGIRLDQLAFDRAPLSEVVRFLVEESRKRDPQQKGINVIINQELPPAQSPSFTSAFATEAAHATNASSTQIDLSTLTITIDPPLKDIRLADAFEAIVKVAPKPIKWSVLDHAVVLSAQPTNTPPPLLVRTFKVDPHQFIADLLKVGAVRDTDTDADIVPGLVKYFAQANVDLDPVRNPGKAIFYNDRQGLLLVRATKQDLDIIERLMQALGVPPPQLNIKCKFIEVSQDDRAALGFDWYLGNTLVSPGAPGLSNGAPAAGMFPGATPRATNATSPNTQSPGVGLPQSTNGSPVLNGILTEPQYQMVLKALQQRNGVEVLAQPEVTTLSGRQAQCKVAEVRTILTGIKKEALTSPGIQGTNNTESAALATEQMEFGPVLDIVPNVSADGKTISLQVVASLTEFLGYEDSRTNQHTVYVNGKARTVIAPLPKFRNCQLTSMLNVQDGQTIVLEGLISEHILTMKDKVPVLGSLPVAGPLFRSESKSTQKRNLLVFITPTLIDPAGNRIHAPQDK